ncbi:hypothetical protein JCM6882_008098 [Rhodosporidiobolus microsporus]
MYARPPPGHVTVAKLDTVLRRMREVCSSLEEHGMNDPASMEWRNGDVRGELRERWTAWTDQQKNRARDVVVWCSGRARRGLSVLPTHEVVQRIETPQASTAPRLVLPAGGGASNTAGQHFEQEHFEQPYEFSHVPVAQPSSAPSISAGTLGPDSSHAFSHYSHPFPYPYGQHSLAKRTSPAEISYGASRVYGISREKWRRTNAGWV